MAQLTQIDTINGVMIDESGRLAPEILKNSRMTDFWTDLGEVEDYPEHMGPTISVATYEPTRPASQTWTKVRPVDASGESVSPTASTVVSAKTMQSWDLYQTALKSEKLNLNDLLISVQCEAQLGAIHDNLTENTVELMRAKSRLDYMTLSKNQIVLDASYTESTTMSTNAATREISNVILGRYRQRAILGGAGVNPIDRIDGKPVLALVCGEDVSEALKAELGENLRFAGRASEMLTPYGVDAIYQNFAHMCDARAPRYTHDGSIYHEVLPYTTASDSIGSVDYLIPNTAYEVAPFTDSIIFDKNVVKTQFPNSKTTGEAAGVSFDPRNYRGEWTWENIKSHLAGAEYNPLGQIGFFYGVVRRGSKPGKPRLGYVLRHLRPGYAA